MKTLPMMNEKKEMTEKEAWNKLSALCAKAEHCSGEMVRKMSLWGLDSAVQERIMNRLIAGKYVDDERYTRAFVNDKMTYNQWGRLKIEQALYQKGVSRMCQTGFSMRFQTKTTSPFCGHSSSVSGKP